MKKKLYISLPISGRPLEDVKYRAEWLKVNSLFTKVYDAITPFDVCPDSTLPYNELMGRDIAALLDCDAILLDWDWKTSKGCRAEKAIAEIYGKPIMIVCKS